MTDLEVMECPPQQFCEVSVASSCIGINGVKMKECSSASSGYSVVNKKVEKSCLNLPTILNGGMGNCTNTLTSQGTCSIICDDGYTADDHQSCYRGQFFGASCVGNKCDGISRDRRGFTSVKPCLLYTSDAADE